MTNCLSRLINNITYKISDFISGKTPKSPSLIRLTTNFYCLKRIGGNWTKQQTSLLIGLINYQLFNPIPKSFVESAIFGSYNHEKQYYEDGPIMILFNYDIFKNEKRSLRGIACVSEDSENNLILDLIGNISVKNKVASSTKEKYNIETKSGKDMIEYLKKFAKKKKYNYFILNSMENVIGFYWKYGWRFKKNKTYNENRNYKIWSERILKLNKVISQTDDGDDERNDILAKYFDRFLPGYYNDSELSNTNTWYTDHSDYGIETTLQRQRWDLRFQGYPMYFKC